MPTGNCNFLLSRTKQIFFVNFNIKGKGIRRNKNKIYKFVIQRIKQSLVLVSFFTAVILVTSCKLTFIIHNLNEQNSRLNFHYF